MPRRRFHTVAGIVLAAMLVIGCAGEGSSASEGLSDAGSSAAVGFEPIPEDATPEALEAAADFADDAGSSKDAGSSEDIGTDVSSEEANDAEKDILSGETDAAAATLVFAGDFLLQDYTMAAYDQSGLDGLLSESLREAVQSADLAMVNEEFPFGTGGEAADKTYTFQADPAYVRVLTDLGVDIVSLANNHILDFGQDVLSQTFATLDGAGIDYVGAGETIERAKAWISYDLNGISAAVLSASRVIPEVSWDVRNSQPGVFSTYDSALLVEQIETAKQENDLVIVYVHWGIESSDTPEDYQRELAYEYIDAGADLVIGSHPHVLQGLEYYNGVPILYSLGNFIFNYTIERTALLEATAQTEGEETELTLRLIPAAASGARTYELEGDAAQELFSYMESISFGVSIDEDGYVYAAP